MPSKEKLSEDERIRRNTVAIEKISQQMDHLEVAFKSSGFAPTYSFAFGQRDGNFLAAKTGIEATGDPVKLCDKFCENTTSKDKTVTVKVKNTDDFPWQPDIDGTDVGSDDIGSGKTKTLIVTLPAGKSLHAQGKGVYEVISVT